jgi:cell division protein FtsW
VKLSIKKNGKIVLFCVLTLVVIGIYEVYSSSNVWALYKENDSLYFFKRQLGFGIVGIIGMLIAMRINLNYVFKYYKYILYLGLLILILVLVPGIGMVRGGSRSWFGIGSFAIQPAEFFKAAIIIYGSVYLSDHYKKTKKFFKGIVPLLLVTFIGFGLIMLQPDLGSGVVMIGAVVIMSIVSRASIKNYLKLGALGIIAFAFLVISAPYRINRITAFIDPWQDPLGTGFQIIQSLYALGPGGLLGSGIDGSIQKHFYLPEPQTDFIFAIFAEEFGFVGCVIVLLLFGCLIVNGFRIAKRTTDLKSSFLAVGITSLIAIQVVINLCVVVGLFPVTGITLPFFSYGGSSLVLIMFLSGLLIGIDRKVIVNENNSN